MPEFLNISIDLNCDMGESFGAYTIGNDSELIRYASSVNIACGFHAGDPRVMRRTVELALQHGVAIGAHPGLPDKEGFGRREMAVSAEEVYDMTLYQIAALDGITRAAGGAMIHVKPHGALYNMLAVSEALSSACAKAVYSFNPHLTFVGLANSTMTRVAAEHGLRIAEEGFADRTYLANGLLTPRSQPNALLHTREEAVRQAVRIALRREAQTHDSETVAVKAHTICLHGDNPDAVPFAEAVVRALQEAGVTVRSFLPKKTA